MTEPWTLGNVLGVWGHPDDEGYLSAAHMMRALDAGYRVACVTASRGELGSTDPVRWPAGPELASVRTAEMEASLAVLGVTDHVWLDYPDGGVADVDPAEGTARVLEQIRRTRPDTILTFGPDGMTGHDDHIAVSRWVDLAVAQHALEDGGSTPTVLHATNTPEWLGRWRATLDQANVYMGAEPPCHERAEQMSHIDLTPRERDRKVEAMLCQISQIQPLLDLFGTDKFHEAMSEESFV
jgi:LmbE family N-acetylglucosaminyl deacetylase